MRGQEMDIAVEELERDIENLRETIKVLEAENRLLKIAVIRQAGLGMRKLERRFGLTS